MSLAFEFDPGLTAHWRGAVDAHKAHAASEWPREACGVIRPDDSYLPCRNVAEDPVAAFRLPDGVFEREAPLAVLHSHTSSSGEDGAESAPQDCPSAADMACQADTAIPWGVTLVTSGGASDPFWFGDEIARAPLLGRPFRHGVHDCYSLIRDWHAEVAGIAIPDFPRDPSWWEPAQDGAAPTQDLYEQGFAQAGFARIERTRDDIRPGDVFLCRIHSGVLNHGGVYVGDGLIMHHVMGHLSKRDPASVWRPKLTFLVRHEALPEDWQP